MSRPGSLILWALLFYVAGKLAEDAVDWITAVGATMLLAEAAEAAAAEMA